MIENGSYQKKGDNIWCLDFGKPTDLFLHGGTKKLHALHIYTLDAFLALLALLPLFAAFLTDTEAADEEDEQHTNGDQYYGPHRH